MIIALLILIVAILLFGAGVVKGFLANTIALAVGGVIVLTLALWLGSYLGEYGLIWVIVIVASLFGLAVLVEDHIRTRKIAKPTVRKPGEYVKPTGISNPSISRQQQQFHSRSPSREERKKLRGR